MNQKIFVKTEVEILLIFVLEKAIIRKLINNGFVKLIKVHLLFVLKRLGLFMNSTWCCSNPRVLRFYMYWTDILQWVCLRNCQRRWCVTGNQIHNINCVESSSNSDQLRAKYKTWPSVHCTSYPVSCLQSKNAKLLQVRKVAEKHTCPIRKSLKKGEMDIFRNIPTCSHSIERMVTN